VLASTVLLSVVADGVVDAVVSDEVVADVDDAEAGNELWDVPAVGPAAELGAVELDGEPDALGCWVTETPVTVASDGDWTGAASNVVVDCAVASAVEVNPTKIPTAAHTVTIASTAAVPRLDDTAPRARRTAITASAPDVTASRSAFSIRLKGDPPGGAGNPGGDVDQLYVDGRSHRSCMRLAGTVRQRNQASIGLARVVTLAGEAVPYADLAGGDPEGRSTGEPDRDYCGRRQ